MKCNEPFSERLIEYRRRRGLSQEQLGEAVGVTRQTVSKWELGATTPELDKLIQLAGFFGVSIDALVGYGGPASEAPAPAVPCEEQTEKAPQRWRYEYRSSRTIAGIPLVHVNIGLGRWYRARGIVAVGNDARGLVAVGGSALGLVAVGGAGLGLLSLGGVSVGLLLSAGGIAVGSLAAGGLAVGLLALGGCAVGLYAAGGLAVGARVAAGGFAVGPVAIGLKTVGEIEFLRGTGVSPDAVRAAILARYADTPRWLADLLSKLV